MLFSDNSVVDNGLFDVFFDVSLDFEFISNKYKVESNWLRFIKELVQFFLNQLILLIFSKGNSEVKVGRLGLLKEFVQFFLILLFVVVVSDLELINPLDSLLGLFFDKLINNFHWCWSNEVASFLSLLSFGWVV